VGKLLIVPAAALAATLGATLPATGCSSAPKPVPPKGAVALEVTGMVENGPFRFGQEDLPGLPKREVRAVLPGSREEERVGGISLAAVLTKAMRIEAGADTAVVTGEGGVAMPVPLFAVLQFTPVLTEKGSLVWPNAESRGLESDPRIHGWWVAGVRRIDLVSWVRTYGKALRVPPGAEDAARFGAEGVATECIGCHRVRGAGGSAGADLVKTFQARGGAAFLEELERHPATPLRLFRPQTREASARIVQFLKAVAAGERSTPSDDGDRDGRGEGPMEAPQSGM
jgi:mono/diheme cytochrome c family protein